VIGRSLRCRDVVFFQSNMFKFLPTKDAIEKHEQNAQFVSDVRIRDCPGFEVSMSFCTNGLAQERLFLCSN
jgi:hypothetical protein